MFVESHSTTLPTAPVVACVIFSSTTKEPETPVTFIAFVPLKVVEWDSANNILYYIQTRHTDEGIDSNGNQTAFSGTNAVTGAGGATGTPTTSTSTINNVSFTSGYSASEIDADSGDILYIENRAPITRAADQTENIKLVIEF